MKCRNMVLPTLLASLYLQSFNQMIFLFLEIINIVEPGEKFINEYIMQTPKAVSTTENACHGSLK